MANTVFISYAGSDPQWPAATVHALGLELEKLGATVLLDQFHLKRQAEPGKLSIVEWRDWMKDGLGKADRVICLISTQYAEAVTRDLKESWGYGVAYESLKLIGRLYEDKGHNGRWILTLRPDGMPLKEIPEDLRQTCPEYQWPRERIDVLEHAIGRRMNQSGNGAAELPAGDANTERIDDGLAAQAQLALTRLRGQPDFFKALVRNMSAEALAAAPRETRAAPESFVAWLAEASRDAAQEVMWAVRNALEDRPAFRTDRDMQKAAIAVYMLCALRWVDCTALPDGSRVVPVPTLGRNVLAVLSAALFGGHIEYALQTGTPQPLHLYDVRAPAGEAASANLLRAIYCALFADEPGALETARRDDEDPRVIDEMAQRLKSRLNDIRRRRKLNLTLVIDRAGPFLQAAWAPQLDVTPLVVDTQVAQTIFLLDPHQLDQEILEMLRLLQHPGTASASAESPA